MSIMAIHAVSLNGVPRNSTCVNIDVNDNYPVVYKNYECSQGHDFNLAFESPIDMPVLWECPSCETIAFES